MIELRNEQGGRACVSLGYTFLVSVLKIRFRFVFCLLWCRSTMDSTINDCTPCSFIRINFLTDCAPK